MNGMEVCAQPWVCRERGRSVLALMRGMMYCGQVLHQCTGIRYACHHAHQTREPRTAGMDSEYKGERCIHTYINRFILGIWVRIYTASGVGSTNYYALRWFWDPPSSMQCKQQLHTLTFENTVACLKAEDGSSARSFNPIFT